jgi:hypothetical protein
LGQPLPERRRAAVAFAEVAEIDEELDGGVVVAGLLGGDECVDPLPRGGLVDGEGVEVTLSCGGRGPFAAGLVPHALFGVASFAFCAEVRGGVE